MANAEEAARDSKASDDPAARIVAVASAYRNWTVAHPQQFRLVYGDPVPGYQAPADPALTAAAKRCCAVLLGLVAATRPQIKAVHGAAHHRWADIDPALAAVARDLHHELPAAAVAPSLRIWGRTHGLVALEVYGHLRQQTSGPAKLYRTEMHDFARDLELRPEPVPGRPVEPKPYTPASSEPSRTNRGDFKNVGPGSLRHSPTNSV